MIRISIIIPDQAVIASITDSKRLFNTANEILRHEGKPEAFVVQLVGFREQLYLEDGMVCIKADKTLETAGKSDLVIIPAVYGDVLKVTQLNRHYFPWIVEQYKQGAGIATYCIGAFILAATGLLKGKKCATHWMYANEFKAYYPEVELMDDKIITEQNGIFTSGGGTSYWNLLLYLLEKYTSRQVVITATKYFLLDIQRNSQAAFTMFKGQKEHGDEAVKSVQELIERNYHQKFNMETIAGDLGLVKRTFERRFRKATKNSVVEYIQRIRIEAAKKEIEMGRKTINEIMYEVGYSDTKAFRDLFTKLTGLSPLEYKKRYGKENNY